MSATNESYYRALPDGPPVLDLEPLSKWLNVFFFSTNPDTRDLMLKYK